MGDHFSALGLYVYFGLFGIQTFFIRLFGDWYRGINRFYRSPWKGWGVSSMLKIDPNGD